MPRLTLCAIARDEQEMLPGLLSSVYGLADEMVIGVDTRTTDRTRQIARQYSARVVDVDWRDDFSYARNLTLEAATGDWVLVLDADERLLVAGTAVVREILDCAPEVPADDAVTGICFWIAQRDLTDRLRVIQRSSARLFRRRPEIRYHGIVHEEVGWIPDPSLTTWALINGGPHFAHYGYDPLIWQQRGKQELYQRLLEQRIADDPSDEYAQDKLRALEVLGR